MKITMNNPKAIFYPFLLCSFFLFFATLALAQQNRAYTGGSGDGYGMAELQVHSTPTGLAETMEKAIRLYPNPLLQGEVMLLKLEPSAQIKQLTLRNSSGTLLFTIRPPVDQQSKAVTLPTDHLPAGIYIFQLSSTKASISRKIVVL